MANILIIEDQLYVLKLLSKELMGEGYEVAHVGDSRRISKTLKDSPPDLILLDLYLDGIESDSICRKIKRKNPSVPVITVTAYDSLADGPGRAMGGSHPIKIFSDFDELKQRIADLLTPSHLLHKTAMPVTIPSSESVEA